MDLPVAPTAMIDLLRAWFFAKDRSIVLAANTCLVGQPFLCFSTGEVGAVPIEKARIDINGNFGVGTTVPDTFESATGISGTLLNVLESSGNARILIQGSVNAQIMLSDSGSAVDDKIIQLIDTNGTFRFRSFNDAFSVVQQTIATMDLGTGNTGFGTTTTSTARVVIDQPSTTGAIPTLIVDQADISEGTINFVASARGTGSTAASDIQDTVRVELNGTIYRLALYPDA